MNPLDVAVIIPAWNRASILPATLDALVAQRTAPRTVIVVDDGSTDGTAEVAETWGHTAAPSFRYEVHRARHGGPDGARNHGVRVAERHAFLHFLDSDDLLPPDWYARMEAVLAVEDGADLASTDQVWIGADGKLLRERSLKGIEVAPLRWIARHDAALLSATCMRWEQFEEHGPLRCRRDASEDLALLMAIANHAIWLHVPGAPVRYRVQGDNLSLPTPERAVTWAENFEEIARETRLPWWERSVATAKKWRFAGRTLREVGDRDGARNAFRRALRVNPFLWRSWRRYVRTFY